MHNASICKESTMYSNQYENIRLTTTKTIRILNFAARFARRVLQNNICASLAKEMCYSLWKKYWYRNGIKPKTVYYVNQYSQQSFQLPWQKGFSLVWRRNYTGNAIAYNR